MNAAARPSRRRRNARRQIQCVRACRPFSTIVPPFGRPMSVMQSTSTSVASSRGVSTSTGRSGVLRPRSACSILQFAVGINDDLASRDRQARRTGGRARDNRAGREASSSLVRGRAVRQLRDVLACSTSPQTFTILGDLDALRRGADDIDAVFLQSEREVQQGLAAELRNRADIYPLVDVQHVFEREQLEK